MFYAFFYVSCLENLVLQCMSHFSYIYPTGEVEVLAKRITEIIPGIRDLASYRCQIIVVSMIGGVDCVCCKMYERFSTAIMYVQCMKYMYMYHSLIGDKSS